jgi:hypothetical protein
VVRVQTTPTITESWLNHLKELLREFPDHFELWAFLDPPSLPEEYVAELESMRPSPAERETPIVLPAQPPPPAKAREAREAT